VPKAVQAMNKLVNRDNIFFSLFSGGTPQMDAVLPMMLEKGVPSVFPSTCARSMYSPFNKLKYGQFSSYYDPQESPHLSDWPKNVGEERLLLQHLGEALHQRA